MRVKDIKELKLFLKVRTEERKRAEERAPKYFLGKRTGDIILVKKQFLGERRTA